MADFTVQFTVPTTDSDMGYDPETGDSVVVCSGYQNRPLTGVSHVRLYTYEPNPYRPVLHHEKVIEVLPGETDTMHIDLTQPRLVYITTLDPAGNESCASNGITIGPVATGVEPTPQPPASKPEGGGAFLLFFVAVLIVVAAGIFTLVKGGDRN